MNAEIEFINVGRRKLCWKVSINQRATPAAIERLVKPKLMSRDVEAVFDEHNDTEGMILVGGFRPVGRFKVQP